MQSAALARRRQLGAGHRAIERVVFVQGVAMLVVLAALGFLAYREAREARGELALDEAVI